MGQGIEAGSWVQGMDQAFGTENWVVERVSWFIYIVRTRTSLKVYNHTVRVLT